MQATTLSKINKAISNMGDITLIKGYGYFYFIGNNVNVKASGVYVNKISDLTLNEWVNEAKFVFTV